MTTLDIFFQNYFSTAIAKVKSTLYLCKKYFTMINFKDNVLFVLKKRGMNQAQASRMLGISKQAFQYYLKGNVTLSTISNIADVLDTTPATLLSEVPLEHLEDSIPTRLHQSATTLTCPCCGAELKILAKGEKVS